MQEPSKNTKANRAEDNRANNNRAEQKAGMILSQNT